MANNQEKGDREIDIAMTAMNMIITNDWIKCDELLVKHKDKPLLCFCNGILSFIKAAFVFEDSQIDKASKDFEGTQKLCKDKLKRVTANIKKAKNTPTNDLLEEKTLLEILIADSKLFISLLILMKVDVTQIITTGLFELRRAWKLYSNTQKYLFNMFKLLEPNAEEIYGSDPNKLPNIIVDDNDDNDENDEEKIDNQSIHDGDGDDDDDDDFCVIDDPPAVTAELSLNSVKSLLASVSFGFGLIQLAFSFLQPSVLKLLKFIGFESDRNAALKALFFTSQNKDLRSPFADLIIIMYSTIYIQMCGSYETDMHLNYKELQLILDRNFNKTPNSCLFLIAKAKTELVNKNIDKALEACLLTHGYTSNIRELESLTWYDMGFIHVINLNFELAYDSFLKFTNDSKWSYAFNTYLIAVLNGCLGNFDKVNELVKSKIKLSQRKHPIEAYTLKRIEFLKKLSNKTEVNTYKFLCLELAYLWCYLPYAKHENLIKMLDILYLQTEKTFHPITALIEGNIRVALENKEFAEKLFKESLNRYQANEKFITFEKYVPPFAYLNLSLIYVDSNRLDDAVSCLNKIKNYKDYDHDDRIQLQIRTVEKRIEYKKSLK